MGKLQQRDLCWGQMDLGGTEWELGLQDTSFLSEPAQSLRRECPCSIDFYPAQAEINEETEREAKSQPVGHK